MKFVTFQPLKCRDALLASGVCPEEGSLYDDYDNAISMINEHLTR